MLNLLGIATGLYVMALCAVVLPIAWLARRKRDVAVIATVYTLALAGVVTLGVRLA